MMNMKSKPLGDMRLFFLFIACCGCGGKTPDAPASKQSESANIAASNNSANEKGSDEDNSSQPGSVATSEANRAAEVTGAFSGFESAVEEQPTKPSAAPPQTAQTKPARSNAAQSNTAQSSVPAPGITTAPPTPTPEQLKRWVVNPYEPLHLLACRDAGQAGLVTSAASIGDGNNYVLAGNRLTAWSLTQPEPTHDFSDPANEQMFKALAAAPDGKWLATGDAKGNLQVFDLPEYKQRFSKKIYPSGVAHLTISPDSKLIATASFTGEVTIWDAAQMTIRNKFTVAKQSLQAIAFASPLQLAVAGQDAGLWNVETGKLEHSLTQGGYHATFAVSPNNQQLAFGNEGKIGLWNIAQNKVEAEIVGGFSNKDLAAFSPDGKYLVTASKFMIQVWELATGQLVQVIDSFGWQTSGLQWLPKLSLLMIASENGRVRFWGTAASGANLGWKPLHSPLSMPTQAAKDTDLAAASPAQLMQVIDIRTLPKLPNAKVSASNETLVFYSATCSIEEAKVFYHHLLTSRGWSLMAEPNSQPDAMNFTKQGFGVSLYLSQSPDGSTQVNLSVAGDVDLRRLPKFVENPMVLYEASNSVQYRVKADLLAIETTLLRKFYAAGWTAYARLNTSKNEEVDRRSMTFVRGATTLQVTVQPIEPGSFAISYNKFLTTKSLPLPKDSGFIEFDGSTQPLMVASTAMTLEQTRDFYDKEMAAQGWLRRDDRKQFKDKAGWMDFIRDQCDVFIVLETLESGRTQIRVGEDLQNSSWQLSKPKVTSDEVARAGIEAADFKALNGWTISKYDAEQKQIDMIAKGTTTFAFADAYTKELESLGWKTDGRGVKSAEYLLAEFTKDKAEFTLRATLRDGEIQASFQGDGLLWAKPLPTAKQVIAYETWLRINRLPATLDLLDQYTLEMKTIAGGSAE